MGGGLTEIEWGDTLPNYGRIPKDPLDSQTYIYLSNGYTYQIYAKLETKNIPQSLACTTPCGPGTDRPYNTVLTNKAGAWSCGQKIVFFYKGEAKEYDTVYSSATGKCWLDRNLGASQQATSATDADAYGNLFQWGRGEDGHQTRTSLTHDGAVGSYIPLAGNSWDSKFITTTEVTSWDWLSPQNNNLWQGHAGINNPCPMGWRLPTYTELDNERLSWGSNNSAGAYASPLKLTVGGRRSWSSASLSNVGSYGYYWSSATNGVYGRYLTFSSSDAGMNSSTRADGFSVRCIQD